MKAVQTRDIACCFCAEWSTGILPEDAQANGIRSREIARSGTAVAFTDLSPLRNGHVLVAPLAHQSNTVGLAPAHRSDLQRLLTSVKSHVDAKYGKTLIWEHGIGHGLPGG